VESELGPRTRCRAAASRVVSMRGAGAGTARGDLEGCAREDAEASTGRTCAFPLHDPLRRAPLGSNGDAMKSDTSELSSRSACVPFRKALPTAVNASSTKDHDMRMGDYIHIEGDRMGKKKREEGEGR